MADPIYPQLVNLDAGIAGAYQSAMRPDRRGGSSIGVAEANTIFRSAIDADGDFASAITTNEAKALTLILQNVTFDRSAKNWLKRKLQDNMEAIHNGTKNQLTGSKLSLVREALGNGNIGKIQFRSPGSKVHYFPDLYACIINLINKESIRVFEMDTGGLLDTANLPGGAHYDHDANELYFFRGLDAIGKKALIVHEATHAIQDWWDRKSLVKFFEADAYIAEAIVRIKLGAGDADLRRRVGVDAAKLVIDGRATTTNGDWITAYNSAVTQVSGMPLYARRANTTANRKESAAAAERQQLIDAIREIDD